MNEDNCVKYFLFPKIETKNNESIVDALNDYVCRSYAHLSSFLSQYIWQNQSLILKVVTSNNESHIEGKTDFGDNLEDEWFIVYLLNHLTELDPNLVVKIEDNDGEFLLIEAADYLPKWMQPENSVNRVYLYEGALHVIPMKEGPMPSGTPNVTDAIHVVRKFSSIIRCKEQIQRAINKRIAVFPKQIKEFQHKAHCFVPTGVAALLKHDPTLISAAVRAFYLRDPDDMKVCQVMKFFPPENRVMRTVTFTRCLYAQLIGQRYNPDGKVGWNMPQSDSPSFKAYDLGMKLACGFEIILANYRRNHAANVADGFDLVNDSRWQAFYTSLEKHGYFRDEMIGSKMHKQLLQEAQNYFSQTVANESDEYDMMQVSGKKISELIHVLDLDQEVFQEEEKHLEKEDSDDWMQFTSEELDQYLNEKFLNNNKTVPSSQVVNEIPSGLNAFVSYDKAGLKGAEAPMSSKPSSKPPKINLNEDAFTEALSSVLNLKVPYDESETSSSGMSDYSDNDEDSRDSDDDDSFDNQMAGQNGSRKEMQKMKSYMELMDRELARTQVGQSFERHVGENKLENGVNGVNGDEKEYKPVDIDFNALTNILESYTSEEGHPGPASTLFATMGINLPSNIDK